MISRRTIIWLIAFLLLACGAALRFHWEKAECVALVKEHTSKSTSSVAPDSSVVIGFSVEDLCRPGEQEPWWARCIILGAFVAFVGVIFGLLRDILIWRHKARV